jgi:autotransporter passenger strand-loop-strand repeat protein
VADGAVVDSGGTLVVLSGGQDGVPVWVNGGTNVEGFTTVSAGGTEIVLGSSLGATLQSGGTMVVSSNGMATNVIVNSGATLVLSNGGQTAPDPNHLSSTDVGGQIAIMSASYVAGTLVVSSGGMDLGATIAGVEVVSSGGTATNDLVLGSEIIQSGGVVHSALLDGTLEVASGGTLDQVSLPGAGTLVLDASTSFHGLVAGFGYLTSEGLASGEIDLRDIAFSTTKKNPTHLSFTEAANNLSGTLTVTDGVHTANIALLGQYTASEFVMAGDGLGGTAITFTPPPTGPGFIHGHTNPNKVA